MTLDYMPNVAPTSTELTWIDTEPPGLFPTDQDSFWGTARKVYCDWLQATLFDKLALYWNNLDPATCDEDDIVNYEMMYGIPSDTTKTLAQRRAFVQVRAYRGAFTRTIRRQVIELFIDAVENTPIIFFTSGGVPFTAGGIPFGAGDFDPSAVYSVVEDVPGFAYDVQILDGVDIDEPGLLRELKRITPAPIDDGVTITFVASL